MKTRNGLLLLLCLLLPAPKARSDDNTAQAGKGEITVQVEGIAAAVGVLRLSLFNGPDGFPEKSEKALARHEEPAPENSVLVTFRDIPYGTCAVSVHHDLNSNGRLDKSFFGRPKEPIAVSNHPKIRFRAPRFREAGFIHNKNTPTIPIKMGAATE